jgi:hypothetical protein
LVLFGHENASSEIRLKTFFELFDNAAFFDVHFSRAIDNRIHRLDRLANNSTGSMHGPCA